MTKASRDLHVEYGTELPVLGSMMKFITVLDCTLTELINRSKPAFLRDLMMFPLAKISESYKWEEGNKKY